MRNRRSLIFAILSIAFPFATIFAVIAYQSFENSQFWNSLGPEDSAAGALMAFVEITQLLFLALLSFLAGFILGVISLLLKPQKLAVRIVGCVAVALNGVPLLFFAVKRLINPGATW